VTNVKIVNVFLFLNRSFAVEMRLTSSVSNGSCEMRLEVFNVLPLTVPTLKLGKKKKIKRVDTARNSVQKIEMCMTCVYMCVFTDSANNTSTFNIG
jgi:hypothetical protein